MWGNFIKSNINYIILISLLVVSAIYRFVLLGYSDLQGDEAKIFLYLHNDSFWNFLMQNSKGPGQYVIVSITEYFFSTLQFIDTEFLYRLPFALAGFLSTVLFFRISNKYFNFEIGLNTLLIASLNGFFIAFSRIIQYQSFNILLGLLSSLFFLQYLKGKDRKDLIVSSLFASIALLFHYDALGFIVPQLILIFLTNNKVRNYITYLGGLSTALIFYIPYVLNENFALTVKYLINDRAVSNFSYDSIPYSLKLSTIYFPKEYLLIIFALIMMSLWRLRVVAVTKYRSIFVALFIIIIARFYVGHPYKPLTLVSVFLGLGIFYYIFTSSQMDSVKKYFYVWSIVTFTTYILLINKPLTHIYNVFIPLTFIAGYQLHKIQNKILKFALILVIVISGLSFNYQAYLENNREYPWESEKYIFGNMYQGISEGEVVRGIFGFPYYRGLNLLDSELGEIIGGNISPSFSSNIKSSRLDFYLSDISPTGHPAERYYIEVKNDRDYEPQDTTIMNSSRVPVLESEYYTIYKVL